MTFSSENSSKEEHSSQNEGKKMSSANLAIEGILFQREDLKILLLIFLGILYSEKPREQHPVFFY